MKIKSFFNKIGFISFSNDNGVMYRVNKYNYPLISQKYGDFIIFKNIVELIKVNI